MCAVLDRQVYWRRRLTALGAVVAPVAVAAAVMGSGGGDEDAQRAAEEGKPPPPPELPRGGRSILPDEQRRTAVKIRLSGGSAGTGLRSFDKELGRTSFTSPHAASGAEAAARRAPGRRTRRACSE